MNSLKGWSLKMMVNRFSQAYMSRRMAVPNVAVDLWFFAVVVGLALTARAGCW